MDLHFVAVKGLKDVYDKKGYAFFTNGDYNLNIFGIRTYPGTVNKFDDVIGLAYKVNDNWVTKAYAATTDPGLYWLNNLMNTNGTAILKEGQYRGGWKVGYHKGQYKALVQNKPVTVYRDRNKDNKHDFNEDTLETGLFGINIHRATANAGQTSTQVDKWSAGCQVIAAANDFTAFMSIIDKAAAKYGSVFTYTLFNERDFAI